MSMDLYQMIKDKAGDRTITQAKKDGKYIFITWAAHLRAWIIYAELFGKAQSAERLADRGGFGESELNDLYPEWRNHIVD